MATDWYYFKGQERIGPIGSQQLKDLAATGNIQPADLVWKEGMAEPQPAAKLKGLFEIVPAAPPRAKVPPRIPQSPAESVTQAKRAAPLVSGTPPGETSLVALWNPRVLPAFSFFLSWGFGAWLLAENWRALGQPEKAKRAMFWFYGLPVFMVINLVMPNIPGAVVRNSLVVIFLAWFFLQNEPQRKLVLATYEKQFIHRSGPSRWGLRWAALWHTWFSAFSSRNVRRGQSRHAPTQKR